MDLKSRGNSLPSEDSVRAISSWIFADSSRHSFSYTLDKTFKSSAINIHYVPRHADVMKFLKGDLKDYVSLKHYDDLLESHNGGMEFFLGVPNETKARRWEILKKMFEITPEFSRTNRQIFESIARRAAQKSLNLNQNSITQSNSIDAIRQYGFQALFYSTQEFTGLSIPTKPALLVRVVNFFRNLGKSHKVKLRGDAIGEAQLLLWSQIIFGHVFSNVGNRNAVLKYGNKYASKKYRAWIEHSMSDAHIPNPNSLIARAKTVRPMFQHISDELYQNDIVNIVLELAGASLILVGISFGNILSTIYGQDESISSILEKSTDTSFIDEALRLSPTTTALTRIVKKEFDFHGHRFCVGDNIYLMLADAMRDPEVFPSPDELSDFSETAPKRNMEDYLNFGPNEIMPNSYEPSDGTHPCFGQYWARELMLQLLITLNQCEDLKPQGELEYFMGTPDHFPLSFSKIKNR